MRLPPELLFVACRLRWQVQLGALPQFGLECWSKCCCNKAKHNSNCPTTTTTRAQPQSSPHNSTPFAAAAFHLIAVDFWGFDRQTDGRTSGQAEEQTARQAYRLASHWEQSESQLRLRHELTWQRNANHQSRWFVSMPQPQISRCCDCRWTWSPGGNRFSWSWSCSPVSCWSTCLPHVANHMHTLKLVRLLFPFPLPFHAAFTSSKAEAASVVVHQWIQSRKCCAIPRHPLAATMLQFSIASLQSLHIHERCCRLFELLTSLWFNCPDFVYIIYFNPRRGHKNRITIPAMPPKIKVSADLVSFGWLVVIFAFCIVVFASHF